MGVTVLGAAIRPQSWRDDPGVEDMYAASSQPEEEGGSEPQHEWHNPLGEFAGRRLDVQRSHRYSVVASLQRETQDQLDAVGVTP